MKRLLAALSLAAFLNPTAAQASCGTVEVCSDVASSLVIILGENAIISWETDSENSSVGHYKLFRYDCETPWTCLIYVGQTTAGGSCSTNKEYVIVEDSPGAGWTYSLEVWDSTSQRECAFDQVPQ